MGNDKRSVAWIVALVTVLALALLAQPAQAQTFHVLHNFSGGQDGGTPDAGLTLDKGGNLYGTTVYGGVGYGVVYKLTHKGSGWVVNPLYGFSGGSDGANPTARVIFGPDGTLYGTSQYGGAGHGTVFNLRPSSSVCKTSLCPWMETVLYAFAGGLTEMAPHGGLLFDQAGNIYGTAGVVYELMHSGSGWTESVLFSGTRSNGGVIFDNAGNLYGTTSYGGSGNFGTVFELTPSGSGWTEKVLYNFRGGSDGGVLEAGVIFDPSGNLYGASGYGGVGGGGTVFKLTPSSANWTYSLVYSFTGVPYCGPTYSLTMDGAGNLYGTTNCDGANGYGNVFELSPSNGSWTYTSLHDFTHGSDGGYPGSNVVFDTSGNLYGTASDGGTGLACPGGCGVVWEITP